MSEILKKPYEISIWEDQLEESNGISYYKENKIAVIGSNTMITPNRVYSPVLQENVNGEKTLTFSLRYKYFDEDVGDFVMNPFTSFLVNERKVKLYYKDKWYEFLIKSRQDSSEDYTFSYTATDAFINELSKTGYNIEFNTDLNNNQGTIIELAKETLKNTDWVVDEENSDVLRQLVSEPIYLCEVTQGNFYAKNLDTEEDELIETNEQLYLFYSQIINKETKYVQFLRLSDSGSWREDNNGSYIGTNYRLLQDVTYNDTNPPTTISFNNVIINIGLLNTLHQGHRLVYNPKVAYDPIMNRTVNIYKTNYDNAVQEIYQYDDYVYSTSATVGSIVTSGTDFAAFKQNAQLKGWDSVTASNYKTLQQCTLVGFPKVTAESPLIPLNNLYNIKAYIELEFPYGAGTWNNRFANSFFNSGFTDNASLIGSLARGEKYVFRIRYKTSNTQAEEVSELVNATKDNASIRAVIAGYRETSRLLEDKVTVRVKEIVPSQIYFNFDGAFQVGNSYIRGGFIQNGNYYINNVMQEPSMKYIYYDEKQEQDFVWHADTSEFIPYENSGFNDYLYVIGEAQKGLSQAEVQDINNRIGIFIYDSDDAEKYVYIEDIQIFKFVPDGDEGKPVLPGSAPKAESHKIPYYYLKPNENATVSQITTYTSLDTIAEGLGVSVDDIVSVRNEKCEKVLSINVSQSNYFNILQTLCEAFECWLDIRVEHDSIGRIKLDENFQQIKRVAFKEYTGKQNFAGFKYGINLNTITRTVDSNEIVSKLIVGEPVSEYTNSGTLSITESSINTSKESYILNLNYYINQKLIDNPEECLADLYKHNEELAVINKKIQDKRAEQIVSSSALSKLDSQRHVLIEMLEKAEVAYVEALENFKKINNGETYEHYRKTHSDAEILSHASIQRVVDEIYNNATIRNNYVGIVSNIKKEYNDLELKINGAETYSIVVSTTKGQDDQTDSTKLTISGYVEGFACKLMSDNTTPEKFVPTINKQEYSLPRIYTRLVITSIPENYQISYYTGNSKVIGRRGSPIVINIYDIEHDSGLVKRILLEPDDEFKEKNLGYAGEIKKLIEEKQEKEKEFNIKYGRFIKEGTWESSDYINADLYYLDALQVSNVSAQPKVTYEINVAEISGIKDYESYNFELGDQTYVEDTEFFGYNEIKIGSGSNTVYIKTPIQEEVVVSQIEWHLDEPDQNIITVQNYKTQFEDLFQRINAAVQTVQYNTPTYQRAANILDNNGQIKASVLANSLNQLGTTNFSLAADGLVRIVEDGLLVQNLTKPENLLIIRSNGIDLSIDGGTAWTNVLNPEGINANTINAGTINTNQVLIMDGDNPSFRWDAIGLNAYGYGDNGYDLKTFVRFDKYGLYGIKNGDVYEYGSLAEVKNNAQFGLTWDGFFIRNSYTNGYVSISSDNDFQVVRNINGQEIEKIKIGALDFAAPGIPSRYGINIRNDNGDVVFTTGDDGNLTITGTINATAGNIGRMSVDNDSLQMGTIRLEPGTGIYSTINALAETRPIYEEVWEENEEEEGGGHWERIDTGEVEEVFEPVFMISDVDGTATFNDVTARGHIEARTGTLGTLDVIDSITVGNKNYDGLIQSKSYTPGYMGWAIKSDGTAEFQNAIIRGHIDAQTGTLGNLSIIDLITVDQNGAIQSSNWSDQNNTGWQITDTTATFNDITARGHIEATSGTLNNLDITGGITVVSSGYIKSNNFDANGNTGWKITDTGAVFNNVTARGHIEAATGTLGDLDVIDTITVGANGAIESSNYSTVNNTGWHIDDTSATFNNANVRGTITALQGDFLGAVRVGPTSQGQDHIIIDGTNALIRSSNYQDGAGYGWMINKDGDAVFNNITARGAIRTAVFEYAEIQAVGGIFIFRPSSTIREALIAPNETDLIITVEKPYLFEVGAWCKISNYIDDGADPDVRVNNILLTNGLTHVYRVSAANGKVVTLAGAAAMVEGPEAVVDIDSLVGGALIDMGNKANGNGEVGTHNYGIGVNSSDNTVNLPARAITLFETIIDETRSPKVSYKYRGILGTLPNLPVGDVKQNIYPPYMAGKQGIYTDNMYIGDNQQYIAFYTDTDDLDEDQKPKKKLRISAKEMVFGYDPDTGEEITWEEKIEEASQGADAVYVVVDSTAGNFFQHGQVNTYLVAHVYRGSEDVTSEFSTFHWYRRLPNGNIDPTWSTQETSNLLQLTTADVDERAVFVCEVTIA